MGGRGSSSRSASSARGARFLSQTEDKLSAWLNASNPAEEINARKAIVGVSEFANRRIKMIDSKLYDLGEIMDQTAGDAAGYPMGVPTASKSGYDKYRKAQKEFADLNVLRGQLVQAKGIADSVQAHWEAGGQQQGLRQEVSSKDLRELVRGSHRPLYHERNLRKSTEAPGQADPVEDERF